jgi:hypothetical protein
LLRRFPSFHSSSPITTRGTHEKEQETTLLQRNYKKIRSWIFLQLPSPPLAIVGRREAPLPERALWAEEKAPRWRSRCLCGMSTGEHPYDLRVPKPPLAVDVVEAERREYLSASLKIEYDTLKWMECRNYSFTHLRDATVFHSNCRRIGGTFLSRFGLWSKCNHGWKIKN